MPTLLGSPDHKQEEMVATRSLQIPLVLGTFLYSLFHKGSASDPPQNRVPIRVNGVQGGSVRLQINISSLGNMVNRIEWVFRHKGNQKTLTVADFQDRKTQRPNPDDRFGERLEAVNGTILRIKNLELEDAGDYEARVRLANAENEKFIFILTVHDPVPDPRIWPQVISDTPSACRVTLRCQPSGPGDFNVSWRFESTPILEVRVGSADWYQLSANGTDLHLSSKPNFTDSNITCLVSNAVDQKQVSFDLSQICSSQEKGRFPTRGLMLFFCVLVPILLVALGIHKWKKRRKASPSSATRFIEESPVELQYAEIAKKRPPEGNEDQDPSHRLDQKYPTVYAQLTVPRSSSELVT